MTTNHGSDQKSGSPFGIHLDQRVALFIEGANFYAAARSGNLTVDYRRLLNHFENNCNFKRAYYYTAVQEEQEYNSIKPLLDFLQYNGYALVTKPLKEHTDSAGRRKVKGSLDVEIAVDVLNACTFCDHIVLFSGDSDFTALVRECQRKGVKVTVVSLMEQASDELRRQADAFVDVSSIRQTVEKLEGPERRDAAGLPPQMVRAPGGHVSGSQSAPSIGDDGQRPGIAARTPIRRPLGTTS